MEREPLSASLDRYIRARVSELASRGWWWAVTDDAPETYAELRARFERYGYIPISGASSQTSIYGSPSTNVLFRVWHDYLHIVYRQDFSVAGEMEIARRHVDELSHPRDKALIWADTAGQVEYYRRFGEFPTDQRAFVLDYLARGKIDRRF